jgi:iron complex transport system substrate-binding protein
MKRLIGVCIVLFGVLGICYAGQDYPMRIISLSPPLTEELYLLGVEARLVGVTTYCKRPKEAEKKEQIASCINANLERIIALAPDLVLASSLSNANQMQALKDLGINVVSFTRPKNFVFLCAQFLELAKLVGKKEEGEKIVSQAKKRVRAIAKKANINKRMRSKPTVFVQVGANPLFTVTKDSFVNEFIELAGGLNIAREAKTGLYSLEEVLQKDPDVIIIVTMGIVGEEEKKNWESYKNLKAVKNKRIYIVDSDKVCSPTPLSFTETLGEIIKILDFGF